jgi:hypothetical protein
MFFLALFLILLAALVYALERNHRRQWLRVPAGSADVEDRDEARMRHDVAHLE